MGLPRRDHLLRAPRQARLRRSAQRARSDPAEPGSQTSPTPGPWSVGVLTLGLSSYVPLYAQQVVGSGALVAGLARAARTIGWPIAAATAGRFYLTLGFRATFLMGSAFALVGALLLLTVNGDSSVLHLAFPCFVMGIGFGYVASPAVVAAQTAVGWSRRGVATGANMFARSMGSAVGVAVFGAVVNGVVNSRLGGTPPGIEQLSAAVLEPAIHGVFVMTIAFAVVLVVVASLMPTRVTSPEVEVATRSDVATPAAS